MRSLLRRTARGGLDICDHALARAGLHEPPTALAEQSQTYWNGPANDRWRNHTHVKGGSQFADKELWLRIGREHLALFDSLARAVEFDKPLFRVVEWGCGGGANAVHFAARATEYVGVDVSPAALDECQREVAAVSETTFVPVLAEVADPRAALRSISTPCDLFLCTYVFELVPTPEYGLTLLRIASGMLAPNGLALIQVKYTNGSWRTRSFRRNYRHHAASMTTYRIAEFWESARSCGLNPELIHLVPRNELDEHYAYFLLSKRDAAPIPRGRVEWTGMLSRA